MLRTALASVLAAVVVASTVPDAVASPPPPTAHVPPVQAPVVDPFRAPIRPYGPGNRGLEYGTEAGTDVRATADGSVTFAGLVAGSRHVTVLHASGVRTSYSFLDQIRVVVGQRVTQGQVVGTTAGHLHLGARLGDAYFDPASLFARGPVRVRLVPFEEPLRSGAKGERSALSQLVGGVKGAAAWVGSQAGQTLRTAAHYAYRFGPLSSLHTLHTTVRAWQAARATSERSCTPAGDAPPQPPRGRRILVLVGGLGSSSDNASVDDVDAAALGYAPADVLRFSYRGGRVPDPTDAFGSIGAQPYGADDTQVELATSAERLVELLDEVAAAAPDATIDVVAHSQGGVVTRLALDDVADEGDDRRIDRLGVVVTLGTPHNGADLATAAYAAGTMAKGRRAMDVIDAAAGIGLDPAAPSVRSLAETSDVMRRLAAGRWPDGVRAVSIAAEGDLVVPVPSTLVDGSPQVVVPLKGWDAHGDLPGSAVVQRELALALGGAPPTCTSFAAALRGQLLGAGISWAEDAVGATAWVVSLP